MCSRTTWVGIVVLTVIGLSVLSIWWQLAGPTPGDHGLADITARQPELAPQARCLIDSIEADPERFLVDENFYLRAGRDTTFQLRDRARIFTVEFSTGRQLMYLNHFGNPIWLDYGC